METMELKPYLNKIGIETSKKPTLEFLIELQLKHLQTIPFEDLDIPNRARIILDLSRIYNKIIPTKRGGFCYELNSLFHWLLTTLGYKVDMLSARVYNQTKKEYGPEFDHMSLLVHIDEDYLVDVGFGDSFRTPIQLPDGEAKDISGEYKIFSTGEDHFELRRRIESGWTAEYSFTSIPRKFSDYEDMCNFQQDSPDSHFRTRNVCTIATPGGRITLSDSSLTLTENGTKIKTEFTSKTEFDALLEKYFQIKL